MFQVSLGRPEFVPGTPPGHPTAKFLYVIFLYRFFSLLHYYTCNSKTIKSVNVSVIFFVINAETIQECKCNGKV